MLAGAPDERLVALARAGDERAFDEIVRRYRAPLLRYVAGYLPPAAAEDALQQAFINAYAALTSETAKVPVSLRPWMYRVARNAALNAGRDPHAACAPLPDGLDGVERPEEALQRNERLWNVVRALRALPERQRQVIVRHALDGDSHEQIAADLGVSAGAIRQMAHRARRTVRDAAAAVIPLPVLRWLPWGSALAESPAAGGGAAAAKVAAVAVATAVAGGGAVEVARNEGEPAIRDVAARIAPAPARAAERPPGRAQAAPPPVRAAALLQVPGGLDRSGSGSGRGGRDSSGSGSSGSGDTSGSSGSGSSGSDDGGTSGSDGSGSSGSSGSGSGTSGSGSGSSGSGSSGSGSGISGSGSGSSGSGSGTSDSGSGSSGSGSSGSGTSSSGSGSSGSGSDSDDSSGSSGSGSSPVAVPEPTPTSTSGGSGSSGSGGSGPG